MKVAVLGGGVVGLCSAHSLASRGYDVVVYDPYDGPKTSEINAGMIVPSHVIPLAAPGMVGFGLRMTLKPKSPFWIRPRPSGNLLRWGLLFARHCNATHVERSKRLLAQLNLASKQAYLDFEQELDGFTVDQRGLLMIASEAATVDEERHVAAQVRDVGLPATELDPSTLRTFDPGIEIAGAGGVHYPADCHFSPRQFMCALRARLEQMKVRFESSHGDLNVEADQVVVASGVWSQRLVSRLGISMPLLAGKGYSFDVTGAPQTPTIPAILMEGRVAVTPLPNGVRFGGTMEIGPPDARIDIGRVDGIREAVPRYYPALSGFNLGAFTPSVGLRPCSPDGLPYIGRVSDRIIVATGHAMMGMSLGPITGRLVAEVAAGEQPQINIAALRPDRFCRASKLRA